MSNLSRRAFLRLLGVSAGSAALMRDFSFAGAHEIAQPALPAETLRGRSLDFTPVYSAPRASAPVLRELWQNQIVPIAPHNDDWFVLTNGDHPAYIQRTALQPLDAYAAPPTPANPPFWGEVISAVAYVMPYAAVQGAPRAQLGQGAIMRVTDRVRVNIMNDLCWYQLADADGVSLGWSQAHAWQAITAPTITPRADVIINGEQISAQIDGRTLFTARTLFTPALPTGAHAITMRALSAQAEQAGAAWAIMFGDQRIIGVHWHNGGIDHADSVHVSPQIARWLYTHAARVMVG